MAKKSRFWSIMTNIYIWVKKKKKNPDLPTHFLGGTYYSKHNFSFFRLMQNLVKIYQFVLKILSGNEILTIIKRQNSAINCNNPDLVNINAFAKFGQNPSLRSQDIEQKWKPCYNHTYKNWSKSIKVLIRYWAETENVTGPRTISKRVYSNTKEMRQKHTFYLKQKKMESGRGD